MKTITTIVKVYTALYRISMPITKADGSQSRIEFGDEGNIFSTPIKSTQEQIESSTYFTMGQILLASEKEMEILVPDTSDEVKEDADNSSEGNTQTENRNSEIKNVPGITTVQQASEYLKQEYGVLKRMTATYEGVLQAAQENYITFSDLQKPE